jgi:hypothetical protein
MRKWMIVLAVFTVALTIGSKNTKAQTELKLTSGSANTGIIIGVFNAGGSTVSFSSPNFNGWSVFIEVGTSHSPTLQPFFGLDLITVNLSCQSGACLTAPLNVSLSDIGFTQPVLVNGFVTAFSSTQSVTSPSASQTAWDDTGNGFFGMGTAIGTIPFAGPGVFTSSVNGGGPAGPGAYSLTIKDTFSAGGSAAFFNANGDIAAVTPEPGSMLLFGSGLLVVGGILRRRLLHP